MRFAPRTLLFAVTIAVAVGGVVALGGVRRSAVYEVVRVWTWVGANGDTAATAAVVADEAWRGDVVVRLLGRAPSAADAAQVATWTRAHATADGIRFVVVGTDEAEAARRERAVAEAFVSWDRARAQAELVATLAAEDARVDAVTERIRAAQVLGPAAADGEIETLLAERDAAIARRAAAAAALAAGAVPRLEPQQAVVRLQERRALRDAFVAAAVAFAAALLTGVRRAAPTSARDLVRQRAGGRVAERAVAAPRSPRGGAKPAPTAAPRRAPEDARPARAAGGDLATLVVFPSVASEGADALVRAGARLAAAVRAPLAAARPGVLVVTSVADGEGKTTVAAHLAEALAQGGTRTLLVDGSLWSPALAERYRVVPTGDDGKRIASTLDWMQKPQGSHHVVAVELGGGRRLDLVPQFRATRPAPGTAEALFGAFGDAIGRWGGYDVIVVDAAALGTVADTRLLLPFATGLVVVIDAAQDHRRRRQAVRKLLRETDAPLLGFVVDTPPQDVTGPDDAGRHAA